MSKPGLAKSTASARAGRLFLTFRIGAERFALAVTEVAEVLPLQTFKPIAQTPHWVRGVFAHRGELVPVIDMSALSFGQSAPQRTSTRLVLVHYRFDPLRPQLLLGLILEQATDTLRCDPALFRDTGLDNRDAPYLGSVLEDEKGLLQWVSVQALLPDSVRALLFPQPPARLQLGEEG
ncbi:chemotaxis protein CheW [Pseudomonas sp. R5(2019)]|uniref:chemotaxis protein CheW n=1 Tax=Pseudomonas sp. R5(2019) TaxID=2697566 RepID=UPI001413021E|nr:chemotaxis protein CheW [Pseudomonas sp. R5(2019)]NBA94497.1 chemotaxis protein CheW [Pseudomonas sp. R5(2019)]